MPPYKPTNNDFEKEIRSAASRYAEGSLPQRIEATEKYLKALKEQKAAHDEAEAKADARVAERERLRTIALGTLEIAAQSGDVEAAKLLLSQA